jgi:hypothetical protein
VSFWSLPAPRRIRYIRRMLFRSRSFVHEGVVWRVWPSALGPGIDCRPVRVQDIGPPRLFFHSQMGGFSVLPYADASWESVAAMSEDTLREWLIRSTRQSVP